MDDLKPVKLHKKRNPSWFSWIFRHKPLIFVLGVVLAGVFIFSQPGSPSVFHYVLGGGSNLQVNNGRVNVLLLGIAGGNHDGPNLTDTIMVASYDTENHGVTLISIPRDIWLDNYHAKINAVYEEGLKNGNGLGLAEKEIGNVLGITIPYGVRIDFSGFTKAVDLVGGVDVTVENSFDDYDYPIPGKENEMCGYQEKDMTLTADQAKPLNLSAGEHRVLINPQGQIATASADKAPSIDYTPEMVDQYFPCRFEHLSFKKGPLHLDGETALKYVRSRHGTNGEASDFARSRRQQQVLQAFKNKVFSLGTLTDLSKVIGLVKTFGSSLDTDIPQSQYPDFLRIAKEAKSTKNYVIDGSGTPPLLINPDPANYGGAWVLIPPNNDFTIIHQFIQGIFTQEASGSAQPTP